MINHSYDNFNEYRLNKCIYKYNRNILPIFIAIGVAVVTVLWKFMWIAIALICVLAIVAVLLYLYFAKQLEAQQAINLSREDAEEGVEVTLNVTYKSYRASVVFDIPAGIEDEQKFVARNILFENKKGKTVRKNLHFKVKVQDKL